MQNQLLKWESIKQTNNLGHEYWSARDLMLLLGYGKDGWYDFEKAIQKAIRSCANTNLFIGDHFYQIAKIVPTDSEIKQEVTDYFLSKQACHLIAMNGDPHKPEVAAAQRFFAFTAEVFHINPLRLEQEEQLALYRVPAGIEILDIMGPEALYASTLTLRNGHSGTALWPCCGAIASLRNSASVLWKHLGANLFRITQTDAKLKRDNVQDEDTAIVTHHDVGQEVRQAIENIHKKKPEDLPRAVNIRKLVEEKRRTTRKQLKSSPPPDKQEPKLCLRLASLFE